MRQTHGPHGRQVSYLPITEPRPSKAERNRRQRRLGRDYEKVKTRLAEVGFICEGSLAELYTSCGNPNCRCANPDQRHGPYWQLTWKEYGKTVTRRLSAEDAALYREWIANRRQLEAVLEQMRDLSHQAGEYMLAAKGRAFHGPDRPRSRRPPAS
jgi:hypothetical protein